MIFVGINQDAMRPLATALGAARTVVTGAVPLANMEWALARAALRQGDKVEPARIHEIARAARGDLRAALRALEWERRAPSAPSAPSVLPDFFARTHQDTIDVIVSGEPARAIDTALADRAHNAAMLADACLRGRPRRADAWRLSAALSDEDASGYWTPGSRPRVLAARACARGCAPRAPRFPGQARPRHRPRHDARPRHALRPPARRGRKIYASVKR